MLQLPLDDSLSQPPPSVVGSGGDVLSQQLSQLAEQKIENAQQVNSLVTYKRYNHHTHTCIHSVMFCAALCTLIANI